jgi:hypothetical protein
LLKQFSYVLPIGKELKDYTINLSDFTGEDPLEKINANDITTVVFAFENTTGISTTIDAAIADIFFSKKPKEYLENLKLQKIHIFPNPTTGGKFSATFRSDIDASLTLRIIDAATGKTVYSKVVQAIKGDNVVPVQFNSKPAAGVYMISVEGTGVKYGTNRIIMN